MTEMFIEIRIYCIHRNYRLGSDACYFDGFSMIGCPLHFNYRRQKMFQTRQTREKHMKTSHTLPTQPFAWNSTLSFSATLWHMSIIGACSQSAIIFFVYYFRNFAGLKDNRNRIFWSNCLYPQRFEPDFFEEPLPQNKISKPSVTAHS